MTAYVIMVTDKSGSMGHLAQDVIGGFNTFIENLNTKTEDRECKITVVLFDTKYNVLCVNKSLENAPKLDIFNYKPGGFTALYDSVGRAIVEFENAVPTLNENDVVTLVIQTDGFENASEEYNAPSIKAMIDERTVTKKWNVLYIGAGPDTWHQAQSMGVNRNSYINTKATKGATVNTYGAMAQSVNRSFAGDVDWMEDIREANKQ